MARVARLALKSVSWIFRFIQFCSAIIILGIFAYFIATLRNHHQSVATWIRAVTGISGAAALYTLCALCLVWCLGGIAIFSALGVLLDLAFIGAFIYLAYATRHGSGSCSGNNLNTPLGTANANGQLPLGNGSGSVPSPKTACRLNKACFALSIIGLAFFLFSCLTEYFLYRQRRREKSYGPSPDNNYTSGSGKKSRWGRKQRKSEYNGGLEGQKRADTLPQHSTPGDMRASYATDATAVGQEQPIRNKYAAPAATVPTTQQTHPAHIGQTDQTGYTTQPTTYTGYNQSAGAEYVIQKPTYAQQLQNATNTQVPGTGGQSAEMPGEGTYRAYNPARADAY